MTIHVVSAGETLFSIAAQYGVSVEDIVADNGLTIADPLVVGQALIVIPDRVIHTVREGETVADIAALYGISVNDLLYQNPPIVNAATITAGQVLTVQGGTPKLGTLSVNAYVYDFVDDATLRRTLPYLTYVTIFGYGITPNGGLIPADDSRILAAAREYGVAPLLLLTALDDAGGFSSENVSAMLNSLEAREALYTALEQVVQEKNYYGVDVDFEFIPPADKELYASFVSELEQRLEPLGKSVFVALAPKTSDEQAGLLYEAHDYGALGAAADGVLLMTYEWGYAYSEPMAVAPIDKVTEVVRYGLSRIPAYKILMGIPNYAYDWALPRDEGERARTITNNEALALARQYGAVIEYDTTAQTPFFNYTDSGGRTHEVWFEDARSLDAKLRLVGGESLFGVGVWNAMNFYQPLWTLIQELFDIRKVTLDK